MKYHNMKYTALLGLGLLALLLTGCDDPGPATTVPGRAYSMGTIVSSSDVADILATPGTVRTSVPPAAYLNGLFRTPYDPLLQFYLPKYAYFQGLCYSKGDLKLLGQVRVIGAAINTGSGNRLVFSQGGMVTTNPDYLKDRIQPAHRRYAVLQWKEVP